MDKKKTKTTKEAISQNFPKIPFKERAETIAKWKAFPSLIRGMTPLQIQDLGLDNTEIDEFLLLKTREELASHLGVSRRQLYDDERTKEVEEKTRELENRWGRDRTPNVIIGLYRGAVREGDAARAKLWFQFFREWQERSTVKVESEELKKLTEQMRKIAEKK